MLLEDDVVAVKLKLDRREIIIKDRLSFGSVHSRMIKVRED